MRPRAAGFTLIELLVVLVVIGIVLGAVVLAVGGSGARELENAARRAQARIQLACERAALGGIDVGFGVAGDALRFGYLLPDRWQPMGEGSAEELRERALGTGVVLELRRDGERLSAEPERARPQLVCFSSGELTPFELELARADVAERWVLLGRLDGGLELVRDSSSR